MATRAHSPAGTVLTVEFRLEGQDFIALNGGPADFKFNESISLLVDIEGSKKAYEAA
jgi:predicted 3-demethylubiquinone-9 3-methyltransferase (glyoxalase superfamily)